MLSKTNSLKNMIYHASRYIHGVYSKPNVQCKYKISKTFYILVLCKPVGMYLSGDQGPISWLLLLPNSALWKCRGWAVKSTGFKLWCFWSAEYGFESQAETLVSLSKTLNHCFVPRMGRKVVGPMYCVNAFERTQCTFRKEKGFAPVFLAGLAAYCATAPCKSLHGA